MEFKYDPKSYIWFIISFYVRGHTKTIELNREELDRLRVKIAGLKKEMEDYSEDK